MKNVDNSLITLKANWPVGYPPRRIRNGIKVLGRIVALLAAFYSIQIEIIICTNMYIVISISIRYPWEIHSRVNFILYGILLTHFLEMLKSTL